MWYFAYRSLFKPIAMVLTICNAVKIVDISPVILTMTSSPTNP